MAGVDGIMLLLSMAGFLKRLLPGRGNGLVKRVETTRIGKWAFFFGLLVGFTLGDALTGLRTTLGGGSVGCLVEEKVSTGANGSGSRGSNLVEGTGWGWVFDLVYEVCNQ